MMNKYFYLLSIAYLPLQGAQNNGRMLSKTEFNNLARKRQNGEMQVPHREPRELEPEYRPAILCGWYCCAAQGRKYVGPGKQPVVR